jgi:hypothetical protein
MALDEKNFTKFFDTLRAIDLFGTAPPAPPWGTKMPTSAQLTASLHAGENLVPIVFRDHYVTPFEHSIGRVINALQGDAMTVETLAGAVYQHADKDVAPDLHRFLAVISNFYRSFLDARKRLGAGFPLIEQDPPLAMFQHSGEAGPFTITAEQIKQLTGGTIGVVSLPATYRKHPILWASLAHETGGHDVLHADEALLPELTAGVKAIFGGGPIGGSGLTTAQLLSALWGYWIDESASDIYGVLNIGPTFGHNLGVFFAALNAVGGGTAGPPRIRTTSGPDERGTLDPHPTDLLRLDLIIGAVGALSGLAQATRTRYVNELRQLSVLLGGGAKTIGLQGVLPLDGSRAVRLNHSLPLADMQAAARRVGAFIVTSKLRALGNHSIQDLETWDDADEATAATIASAIAKNTKITGVGDDAQLLAGAMLALLKNAGLYQQTTKLLSDALDESYRNDAIWGAPQRDVLWLRGDTVIDPSILVEFADEIVMIDGELLAQAVQ